MFGVFRNGSWKWRKPGAQITGEKMPGDLSTWRVYDTDSNDAVIDSYGILQKRSSSLYHSYSPVSSAIDKTTTYAIGPGNVFRSSPDHRILGITPEEAKEWGKKFQLLLHYYLKNISWYEKQGVVFRGALISGDSLLYFVRDKNGLDLVEAGGDTIDWTKTDENSWKLGIKKDKFGRREAIYTDKEVKFYNKAADQQQVIQFFIKKQPRQLRGMSLAYKCINTAKNHDRFTDATVQRAVLETIIMGSSNTNKTDFGKQAAGLAADVKKKKGGFSTLFNRVASTKEMEGGGLFDLKTDESINFTEMKTPSNNFDKFNSGMIDVIAMATGTTRGVILSNYPTSYSSHRGEFNDFWKSVQEKRASFNEKVNAVVNREVLKELIFSGLISAPGFFDDPLKRQAWLAGSFLGPIPGHINPLQEVNAKRIAVENGFILRSDAAADYGNEFDNIISEWGSQEKTFNDLNAKAQEETIKKGLENA